MHSTGAADGLTLTAIDAGTFGNTIEYTVVNQGTDVDPAWTLVLQGGSTKETYVGANVGEVHDAIVALPSKLVTVGGGRERRRTGSTPSRRRPR